MSQNFILCFIELYALQAASVSGNLPCDPVLRDLPSEPALHDIPSDPVPDARSLAVMQTTLRFSDRGIMLVKPSQQVIVNKLHDTVQYRRHYANRNGILAQSSLVPGHFPALRFIRLGELVSGEFFFFFTAAVDCLICRLTCKITPKYKSDSCHRN